MHLIKHSICNIIIFGFIFILGESAGANTLSITLINNIYLKYSNQVDLFDEHYIDFEPFKLFSNTTIDPELKLALEVSFRIESDGGKNLVGDNGKSIGPLHIQKQAIDDINRIAGYQAFSYDDRMLLDKSCQIFESYLNYYGQKYAKKTGHQPTTEVYVRIWNGGPNGWKNQKTNDHWRRAQEVIF